MPKHQKNRNWKTRNEINGYKIRHHDTGAMNNSGQNFNNYQCYNDSIPMSSFVNYYDTPINTSNKKLEVKLPSEDNGIRTIKRDNLYKIPELQAYMHNYRFQSYKLRNLKNDMKYWKKEVETEVIIEEPETKPRRKYNRKNEFEKKLNKMLQARTEISKGKSMLEKMGWKGGGLGKDGAGILEPIIPKATYATNTFGLGHVTVPEQVDIRDDDIEFNNHFRTNILLNILQFVKNDAEVDVMFDGALWRGERRRVHNIVQEIRDCTDADELGYDNPIDTEIARDILSYNMYVLFTKSTGKAPNRQLCVFKDAPTHIFLIVPDDLKEVEIEVKQRKKKSAKPTKKQENDIELFTKQVKELEVKNDDTKLNQPVKTEEPKTEPSTPTSILRKLVDYFKEFSDNSNYTEYRFLGPFDTEEVDAINIFFDICLKRDKGRWPEKDDLLGVWNNELLAFEVKPDRYGKLAILKHERAQQIQLQQNIILLNV